MFSVATWSITPFKIYWISLKFSYYDWRMIEVWLIISCWLASITWDLSFLIFLFTSLSHWISHSPSRFDLINFSTKFLKDSSRSTSSLGHSRSSFSFVGSMQIFHVSCSLYFLVVILSPYFILHFHIYTDSFTTSLYRLNILLSYVEVASNIISSIGSDVPTGLKVVKVVIEDVVYF